MTLNQLYNKARREYMRHPRRSTLRVFLIYKARKGIYDPRMWDYYRVPALGDKHLQQALVRAYARGLVATATTNGSHAPTSYHRLGKAVDFGLIESHIGTDYGRDKLVEFQHHEFLNYKSHKMVEVIGPTNFRCVLRGRKVTLQEGIALENMHDNHVHEAVA
jgi:hypothetical protein